MDRKDLMEQAEADLETLLKKAQVRLAEFLEEELPKPSDAGGRWRVYVFDKLEEEQQRRINKKEEEIDKLDLAGLLTVLIKNWHHLPTKKTRITIAHQMVDIRNFQAHRTTADIKKPSVEVISRHLGTLWRFFEVIGGRRVPNRASEK